MKELSEIKSLTTDDLKKEYEDNSKVMAEKVSIEIVPEAAGVAPHEFDVTDEIRGLDVNGHLARYQYTDVADES